MFFGYHRKIRKIAAPYIFRPVYLPELRLAIGEAERLEPLPLPLSTDHKVKTTKLRISEIIRQEQTAHQGTGAQFNLEEFPTGSGYVGEGIAYV